MTSKEYVTPEGKDYPKYYVDCAECGKYFMLGISFFPAHTASSYCESGKRPHCTCDWCF